MTEILITILFTILLIPLPLILVMGAANCKELMGRGYKQVIRDLLMSFATIEVSVLIAGLTRPLAFLCADRIPKKATGTVPILMTHGLYHNRTAWLMMKPRLKRAGYGNLHTWSYNSFTTSYPELVLELRRRILRLYVENNNQKIVLIGHSLGGLLIKGAVSDPVVAEKISRIITLGTPFRGSLLAKIALGRLGRSLHPESSLFETNPGNSVMNEIPKTAIYSPVDEMVIPWKNLKPLENGWQTLPCSSMGHVAMLYSSQTVSIIIELIKQ
ncbi:esterase/lipase family protein [Desulfovibrio gilichinskyi]|uniref:PGAP1-like protein n=1 Tax=Desulfovibrio gilichinskyi TaxID=1519643 RepID=A0A1X7DD94_9BACT|nr:alpha/beta fold hydrolase [Desulfovibrio gilichinskyi]SMF12758.1 PGAP1-like protein [Desulfovibrio gilichinskyi]